MLLVSHRGNVNGPEINKENTISHIESALEKSFDVEIDVQDIIDRKVYLGHDKINECIDIDFLKYNSLWCHAKTLKALKILLENKIHCFWHEKDTYTLTSYGYIWSFPTNKFPSGVVAVLPETFKIKKDQLKNVLGICSDYIMDFI